MGAGYIDTCDTFLPVCDREPWTHLRLNYHPDGGVARLRIYGQVSRTWEDVSKNGITMKDGNVSLPILYIYIKDVMQTNLFSTMHQSMPMLLYCKHHLNQINYVIAL